MALEPATTPPKKNDGALLIAFVAIIFAYRWGKAAGSRSKGRVESFGSVVRSYVSLRALDAMFNHKQ